MEIRQRRKPPGAAAPHSLRTGRSGGGAPAAKRRFTDGPTGGAAAPPSFAPPPSARLPHGGGSAPTAKRRRTTGHSSPPSLPPSARMGPGGPGERTKHPPSAASLLHLTSLSTARHDGDGDATGKRKRKRQVSSSPATLRSRTGSEGGAGRNGSAGGIGGPESSGGQDDSTETLGGDGVVDDPSGASAGASGAGHAQGGPPDDPPPRTRCWPPDSPPKNVAVPRGKISVAHTPNVPPRFEGLIRNITTLIPYEGKGKSHECRSDQMQYFLHWCKSDTAFFFEWSDENMEMLLWIHNIKKREFFKFTVNAAFPHEMDEISVQRAAVAFSSNFVADNNECWLSLKNTLLNIFGSFEENADGYDYLYVFTRVGDSVYFRNFKITSLPKVNDASSRLVLTEINTMFCLEFINDQETPKSSSEISLLLTKNLSLGLVSLYSNSNGPTGAVLSHDTDFGGTAYSFLLENGCYISSLEKLHGFNTSLAEIVVKEPLLKVKHIIGSLTNKTHCFPRERCKSIFQSLFAEFATLLESGKCMSETTQLFMHNVLVRGAIVRLYGIDLTDYSEHLATRTVLNLVRVVRNCFPTGQIPLDLSDLLQDMEDNPLEGIRIAKDDCSVLKAEDRRTLLINLNSEFMTNVEKKPPNPDYINEMTFFKECPYADEWQEIMNDNEYMVQVCNLESSNQENESYEGKDVSVVQRVKKKVRMGKNTPSIKKFAKKKKLEGNKGKLQFSSKRNFHMHMPEKARKDGIIPFRLGEADYILTAYFPRFLRFVQKRMREVKVQRGILKKRRRPSFVARGQ